MWVHNPFEKPCTAMDSFRPQPECHVSWVGAVIYFCQTLSGWQFASNLSPPNVDGAFLKKKKSINKLPTRCRLVWTPTSIKFLLRWLIRVKVWYLKLSPKISSQIICRGSRYVFLYIYLRLRWWDLAFSWHKFLSYIYLINLYYKCMNIEWNHLFGPPKLVKGVCV